MTRVARALGVSRSSIYKIRSGSEVASIGRSWYGKTDDEDILKDVKSVVNDRPSYGYKRVTAMLNRTRRIANRPLLNKKRIYRIMKIFGLVLPKVTVKRDHIPTGKVMTLHSNTRWCSDAFEVRCFNGEKVYTAFSLDCKDREAISYVTSPYPLTATDIQNLMITSVENRFHSLRVPRQIEWLTDRGSIYRAINVRQLGSQLGLKCCYTASYSPQSNGMAERLRENL